METTTIKISGKTVDLGLTVGRLIFGKQHGTDLGDLENGPISTMFVNPETLGTTIWNVYHDRLTAAGVESESAFYDALDSRLIREIEAAAKKAIRDFFPWGSGLIEQVEKRMARLTETMEEIETTASPSGQPSGDVPASSVLTPTL